MISEFQALSDKIDQLAELTQTLRRENAHLRQGNARLVAQAIEYNEKMKEATARLEALLEQVPSLKPPEDKQPQSEEAR